MTKIDGFVLQGSSHSLEHYAAQSNPRAEAKTNTVFFNKLLAFNITHVNAGTSLSFRDDLRLNSKC